jgi:glycerophosphoryl diester phosphodiesterase
MRVRDWVLALMVASQGMSTLAQEAPTARNASKKEPNKKLLIAHRGASAYAPEHTIAAYELAIKQGADFVEQDLQISKDGILICMHDMTLERTTNVEDIFPDRAVEVNGKKSWLVADFTLDEIKKLDAGSWFDPKFKGKRVPTFQEAIDAIRGKAGLYPETKGPESYAERGLSMEAKLVQVLRKNKLDWPGADSTTPVMIQSFSSKSLKTLKNDLGIALPLTLLVGSRESAEQWLTDAGLKELATFATGIGPAKKLVADDKTLVARAHAAGITVTPYTFKSPGREKNGESRDEMFEYLYSHGVDALFTDNPDLFPAKQ